MVWTTKRSAAQIHVEMILEERAPGLAALGTCFRHRYRLIERLLTTMPSFKSSPRMRSVPQSRFSREISAMRFLTSAGR